MAALQPPIPTGFTALAQLTQGMDPAIASALQPVLYALQVQFQALAQSIAQMGTTAATTANRPTAAQLLNLPTAGVGFMMLDTTLGEPIWVKSNSGTVVVWINASGTPV